LQSNLKVAEVAVITDVVEDGYMYKVVGVHLSF